MSRYIIYHNPRCQKSRQTLKIMEAKGVEPEIVEYLKAAPDLKLLKKLRALLGVKASEMIRTKEPSWKKTGLDIKSASDEQILRAVAKEPVLLERPIVVRDNKKAVLGRPPENVKKLF